VKVKFFVPLHKHKSITLINITFFQIDAFTDVPFKGNPAAVCLLEEDIPSEVMQQIAMENNLAETAFLLKVENGYSLRWFTPTVEIKLCGHATLASAHVLWERDILPASETAKFFTKSGLLTVTKTKSGSQLNFPRFGFRKADVHEDVIRALGVNPVNVVQSDDTRFVIEIDNERDITLLNPDFAVLKNYETVVVTSKADALSKYDFVSRSFTAAHGVNEDPVTGSSHCVLAPYWAEKLRKNKLIAFQASERGGTLKLEVVGDRVLIEGEAVTIIEGVLKINP
jgi:PhzF family phenazine biosynthesis protein